MKYPEHISEFWRMRSADGSLSNTDFILYSYLCNCCNSVFWSTDRVTQRRDLICGLLNIGASALEESRNRLKQKGLIDFISQTQVNKVGKKQGVKGSATTYIVLNSCLNSVPNSVPDRTPIRHETDTKQTLNDTVLRNINSNENINEIKKEEKEAANATLASELKILKEELADQKKLNDALLANLQKKTQPPNSAAPPSPKKFVKPEKDEVKVFYTSLTDINGQTSEAFAAKFVSYYDSNGWKVGKNSMKDWKAAVRTWIANEEKYHHADNKKLAPNGIEPKQNTRAGKL